jgi:hypothetical protein
MGNPRKWTAGMAPVTGLRDRNVAPLAGPPPLAPPHGARPHPAGMINRYSEQGTLPLPKGAKPPAKPAAARKRRM